jgi:hypothetical protein
VEFSSVVTIPYFETIRSPLFLFRRSPGLALFSEDRNPAVVSALFLALYFLNHCGSIAEL